MFSELLSWGGETSMFSVVGALHGVQQTFTISGEFLLANRTWSFLWSCGLIIKRFGCLCAFVRGDSLNLLQLFRPLGQPPRLNQSLAKPVVRFNAIWKNSDRLLEVLDRLVHTT